MVLAVFFSMTQRLWPKAIVLPTCLIVAAVGACTQSTTFVAEKPRNYPADSVEGTAHKLGVVQGFYGPESVRYSPGQDVYFVSVMNGPGSEKDNNGYIRSEEHTSELQSHVNLVCRLLL